MAQKKKMMPEKVADGRKKGQRKGKTNNIRDWAGLNIYLLENVMGRLPLADCFSFGSVCKPWRSTAMNFLDGCDRNVPCLMQCGHNVVTTKICISNLDNSNFEIEFPDARERCILGSFRDWLFVGRHEEEFLHICMLNPVSGVNIPLPKTKSIYYMMVVSAVPSDENCVCMLVGPAEVAFCTPGAPKWDTNTLMIKYVLDASYLGGWFYLFGDNDTISMFCPKIVFSMLNNQSNVSVDVGIGIAFSRKLPEVPKFQYARYYLVESCGEILLVRHFYFGNDAQIVATSAFETYKLDINRRLWLKLENFKDQVLFVGSGCSGSFHAKEFGDAFANKVYFIDDSPFTHIDGWDQYDEPVHRHENNLGLFSFRDPYNMPFVFQARAEEGTCVWLTAPLGWCLKQRRG